VVAGTARGELTRKSRKKGGGEIRSNGGGGLLEGWPSIYGEHHPSQAYCTGIKRKEGGAIRNKEWEEAKKGIRRRSTGNDPLTEPN